MTFADLCNLHKDVKMQNHVRRDKIKILLINLKVINKKEAYFYMFLSYKPFYPRYQQKITTYVVLLKIVSIRNFVLSFVINLQKNNKSVDI